MEDKNPYGWGLSRNLPILIILLVILGFLTANVITLNNIAIAPEDPNQTVSKNSATSLYWFNLIILIFVLIVIILLIMFMYRNKNTPNVDYFGKNITIIGDETRKNIEEKNQEYKKGLQVIFEQKVKEAEAARISQLKAECQTEGITNENTCNNVINSIITNQKICNTNDIKDVKTCYANHFSNQSKT